MYDAWVGGWEGMGGKVCVCVCVCVCARACVFLDSALIEP
jgi:hypothetical protein